MELNRYHVGRVLGTGAFATVYEGVDPRLQSPVAIKVLADNWSQDPSVRHRFGQEAALLRRVKNQSREAPLIDVFDIDETSDGRPYFVMAYADRGTLRGRLESGAQWPREHVIEVVTSLGNAMDALHTAGVVHRDLKPSNLLFTSTVGTHAERLLIGDLGLANDQLSSDTALTVAGGSPGYMAPEQAMPSTSITPQADIYSASVIVAELLTGSREFGDLGQLPDPVRSALIRGTATDPAARHESAQRWATDLLAALGGPSLEESSDDSSAVLAARGRNRATLALISIGTIFAGVLIIVGAFFVVRGDSSSSLIDGPTSAEVGEPFVLSANTPDDGTHAWIVDEERFSEEELVITPRETGTIEVRLEVRNGDEITTAVHEIEVTP